MTFNKGDGSEWCGNFQRHSPHGWWVGAPSLWHWCGGVNAVMVSTDRRNQTKEHSNDQ